MVMGVEGAGEVVVGVDAQFVVAGGSEAPAAGDGALAELVDEAVGWDAEAVVEDKAVAGFGDGGAKPMPAAVQVGRGDAGPEIAA